MKLCFSCQTKMDVSSIQDCVCTWNGEESGDVREVLGKWIDEKGQEQVITEILVGVFKLCFKSDVEFKPRLKELIMTCYESPLSIKCISEACSVLEQEGFDMKSFSTTKLANNIVSSDYSQSFEIIHSYGLSQIQVLGFHKMGKQHLDSLLENFSVIRTVCSPHALFCYYMYLIDNVNLLSQNNREGMKKKQIVFEAILKKTEEILDMIYITPDVSLKNATVTKEKDSSNQTNNSIKRIEGGNNASPGISMTISPPTTNSPSVIKTMKPVSQSVVSSPSNKQSQQSGSGQHSNQMRWQIIISTIQNSEFSPLFKSTSFTIPHFSRGTLDEPLDKYSFYDGKCILQSRI